MSLPEISRRCISCGASVRAAARFCPQCGYGLGEESEAQRDDGAGESRPTRETAAAPPVHEAAPTTREAMPVTRETAPTPASVGAQAENLAGIGAGPGASVDGAADGGAGRAGRAAARVRERVAPRVGRIRDEALVVLEETPDDSGLRFVVIAVVLFGLFLLLLLLSTTALR